MPPPLPPHLHTSLLVARVRSWPVALAMTLALVMFIYGMYKYGMRIYRRFALAGDGFITGKVRSSPSPSRSPAATPAHPSHHSQPLHPLTLLLTRAV